MRALRGGRVGETESAFLQNSLWKESVLAIKGEFYKCIFDFCIKAGFRNSLFAREGAFLQG